MTSLLSKFLGPSRSNARAIAPLTLTEAARFPRLDHIADPPIPSDVLSIQVLGRASSAQNFLYGGYVTAEGVKRSLELVGRPLHTHRRVLDFGCGSSRVLRWFRDSAACCEFHGSDVSKEAITWNRLNMPFGRFSANDQEPPLEYPDDYFDCIYVISVVTHLDEALQLAWIAELRRVLKPGGVILISVVGEDITASRVGDEELATFREHGHLYKRVQAGLHGLPDFYQDAFHSRSYLEKIWSRYFTLRAYIEHGPLYLQDLVVLEKQDLVKKETVPDYLSLRLPIGGINKPEIASIVSDGELAVRGWMCRLDGSAFAIDISIDGRRVSTCSPNEARPEVGKVHSAWPAAGHSGFTANVSLRGLSKGAHRFSVGERETGFECLSTYFFVE